MFEIVFIDRKTGEVKYAVLTRVVRYITASEVGYYTLDGRSTSISFPHTEKLEIDRRNNEH